MNILTISVLLIYLLSIFFAIWPNIFKNKNYKFIIWLSTILIFSYVIRTFSNFSPDSDMQGYINLMQGYPDPISFCSITEGCVNYLSTYYSREFIFWGLIKYLYIFTKSIKGTLIIIDLLSFICIYFAINLIQKFLNNSYPLADDNSLHYLRYLFIVLFPFLFGMIIVFRQFLSMAIATLAFAFLINNKKILGILLFIISIFTHNGAAILAPLILKFKNNLIHYLLTFSILITIIYFLREYSLSRYGTDLGAIKTLFNLSIYLVVSLFLILVVFLNNLSNKEKIYDIFNFLIPLLLLVIALYFSVPENQFERLSYFIFVIFLLRIVLITEQVFNENKIFRIIIIFSSLAILNLNHPNLLL